MLILIAAVSENSVLGKNNKLLWSISDDLQRFKKLTLNKPIIMGRKTFESLPGILPNRKHIVISRTINKEQENVIFVNSLENAIEKSKEFNEDAFIIGGGEIYKLALNLVDKIELTLVHTKIKGDTFFPEIDLSKWILTYQESFKKSEKNQYDFTFLTYKSRNFKLKSREVKIIKLKPKVKIIPLKKTK